MPPDVGDNDAGQSAHDWHDDAPSPSASIKSDNELDEDGNPQPGASSQPIQKRRRVTRACDECRRKKIKCDGKQPCTHCSVYSYGTRLLSDLSLNRLFLYILTLILENDAAADCYMQNAHTINLQTGEETRPHNTSKPWKVDCNAPSLYFTNLCPMSTWPIRILIQQFSKNSAIAKMLVPKPRRLDSLLHHPNLSKMKLI
jgi:hypothetical protein